MFKNMDSSLDVKQIFIPDYYNSLSYYSNLLSIDEKMRRSSFCFEKDRINYTLCRGLLKERLSQKLNIHSDQLQFEYNEFGKPFLKKNRHYNTLEFNISHSGDWLLIGISEKYPIGVDIEVFRDIDGMVDIINSWATEEEKNLFFHQAEKNKESAFFYWWTRKEAFGKARGIGINSLTTPVNESDYYLITEVDDKLATSICVLLL